MPISAIDFTASGGRGLGSVPALKHSILPFESVRSSA